jgi:prostaglandin-endoperoxide synthase 2
MASLLMQTLGVLAKVPPLQPVLNRVAINMSVGRAQPRPYPYSLWSPDRAPEPKILVTPTPYITWPGLVDRRYTGRHLPPAPAE